jgi:hypothetical protein
LFVCLICKYLLKIHFLLLMNVGKFVRFKVCHPDVFSKKQWGGWGDRVRIYVYIYMSNTNIFSSTVQGFYYIRHNYMFRPLMLTIFRFFMSTYQVVIEMHVGNIWGVSKGVNMCMCEISYCQKDVFELDCFIEPLCYRHMSVIYYG